MERQYRSKQLFVWLRRVVSFSAHSKLQVTSEALLTLNGPCAGKKHAAL